MGSEACSFSSLLDSRIFHSSSLSLNQQSFRHALHSATLGSLSSRQLGFRSRYPSRQGHQGSKSQKSGRRPPVQAFIYRQTHNSPRSSSFASILRWLQEFGWYLRRKV